MRKFVQDDQDAGIWKDFVLLSFNGFTQAGVQKVNDNSRTYGVWLEPKHKHERVF